MLYEKQTTGTIDSVVANIERAAAENQFGILGNHDLTQKMKAKGLSFEPECRVIEVCNPGKATRTVRSARIGIGRERS